LRPCFRPSIIARRWESGPSLDRSYWTYRILTFFVCAVVRQQLEKFARSFGYYGLPSHSASIEQRHPLAWRRRYETDSDNVSRAAAIFRLFIVAAGLKAASLHSFIPFVFLSFLEFRLF
jgi:hypothetical protein